MSDEPNEQTELLREMLSVLHRIDHNIAITAETAKWMRDRIETQQRLQREAARMASGGRW